MPRPSVTATTRCRRVCVRPSRSSGAQTHRSGPARVGGRYRRVAAATCEPCDVVPESNMPAFPGLIARSRLQTSRTMHARAQQGRSCTSTATKRSPPRRPRLRARPNSMPSWPTSRVGHRDFALVRKQRAVDINEIRSLIAVLGMLAFLGISLPQPTARSKAGLHEAARLAPERDDPRPLRDRQRIRKRNERLFISGFEHL